MKERTFYTAVGRFCGKPEHYGENCPTVFMNREAHTMDIQELAVWTALCWEIADFEQLETRYAWLMEDVTFRPRSLEFCVERLQTRGLIASGTGDTDFEAIYDLLGGLYIIPVSEHISLRMLTFLKLVICKGIPWGNASRLFRKDRRSAREKQVMALSKQAMLSTAELIQCVGAGVNDVSTDEKLLDALCSDEHSSNENLPFLMRGSEQQVPVTMAVANLYLRKQIILERL